MEKNKEYGTGNDTVHEADTQKDTTHRAVSFLSCGKDGRRRRGGISPHWDGKPVPYGKAIGIVGEAFRLTLVFRQWVNFEKDI